MSTHPTEETLNLYFDGSVSQADADAIGQHIDACKDCAKTLESFGEMREVLVNSIRAKARGLDGDTLFARIEAEVAQETPAKVIAFPRRRAAVASIGVVLAAAAAIGLWISTANDADESVARQRITRSRSAVAARSEVEEVGFGDNAIGTVFELPNGDEQTVAVVWISDE